MTQAGNDLMVVSVCQIAKKQSHLNVIMKHQNWSLTYAILG